MHVGEWCIENKNTEKVKKSDMCKREVDSLRIPKDTGSCSAEVRDMDGCGVGCGSQRR